MSAIRMRYLEMFRCAEKFVDGPCRLHHGVHAAPLEVLVSEWGADETAAWSQGSDEFVEIEREVIERIIQEARHVTFARPAFDVAIFVITKGIEPAA